MTAYTLVIVDMQPCFSAANDKDTLKAIKREIKRAKELGMPIIALEIDCFSPLQERLPRTHKRLLELLVGYRRYRMEEKRFNDGSCAVVWAMEMLGCEEEARSVRVCGVNTDACVLETVLGLAKRLPQSRIAVVKDACNTSSPNKNCWPKFTPPNVLVVSKRRSV